MHYSMLIQGSHTNGTFEWINPYKFQGPYNTSMTALFLPPQDESSIRPQAMFNNVDTTNIVSNSGGEEVTISPGYYTLSEIIVILNTMTNTSFSIFLQWLQVMVAFGSNLHILSISLMHRIYEKFSD